MLIRARDALLLATALAYAADAPLPKFDSPGAVESFFFPAEEEAIFDSMKAVFGLANPGALVTAAANAGPDYALKVAATIQSAEFRAQYSLLAKYLKLFGPCQRKQTPDKDGWWSSYTEYPGDAVCSEATKLIFATALCSQVHYCQQLATGEVKPRFGDPPAHAPPYRLDEEPVRTVWVNAAAVYATTDAAVAHHFHLVLRKRSDSGDVEPAERSAMQEAAAELEREPLNREVAGLKLLKLMLRSYEAVHLRHLRKLEAKLAVEPKL